MFSLRAQLCVTPSICVSVGCLQSNIQAWGVVWSHTLCYRRECCQRPESQLTIQWRKYVGSSVRVRYHSSWTMSSLPRFYRPKSVQQLCMEIGRKSIGCRGETPGGKAEVGNKPHVQSLRFLKHRVLLALVEFLKKELATLIYTHWN